MTREDRALDAIHVFQVASPCRKRTTALNIVSKSAADVIDYNLGATTPVINK